MNQPDERFSNLVSNQSLHIFFFHRKQKEHFYATLNFTEHTRNSVKYHILAYNSCVQY